MNPYGRPRLPTEDVRLVSLYESGWSESRLAREFGLARSTVHRRLLDGCDVVRSSTESRDLLNHKTFDASEPFIELVDGLLLGDASIEQWANSEGRMEITQRRACVDWLYDIQSRLATFGVESRVDDRGLRGFQLRTKKYVPFTELRQRWYPKGKKIIPRDVRLTPLSIAQWYWGDGSTSNNGYTMSFCTDGFTWRDVRWVSRRLRVLYGWASSVVKHQTYPKLSIYRVNHRLALVDLIGPYCPSSFTYKLKIRRPT
jgi:hypothetical protein